MFVADLDGDTRTGLIISSSDDWKSRENGNSQTSTHIVEPGRDGMIAVAIGSATTDEDSSAWPLRSGTDVRPTIHFGLFARTGISAVRWRAEGGQRRVRRRLRASGKWTSTT